MKTQAYFSVFNIKFLKNLRRTVSSHLYVLLRNTEHKMNEVSVPYHKLLNSEPPAQVLEDRLK